jgi:hypothetical protein
MAFGPALALWLALWSAVSPVKGACNVTAYEKQRYRNCTACSEVYDCTW